MTIKDLYPARLLTHKTSDPLGQVVIIWGMKDESEFPLKNLFNDHVSYFPLPLARERSMISGGTMFAVSPDEGPLIPIDEYEKLINL